MLPYQCPFLKVIGEDNGQSKQINGKVRLTIPGNLEIPNILGDFHTVMLTALAHWRVN